MRDVVDGEDRRASRRARCPFTSRGSTSSSQRNRERLSFTTDVDEAVDGADVVYIAVGTPPTYSGDADLSAVWTVVDELPQVDRRIVVAMKSTVPVGTGRAVRHRLDDRGLANVGYVSNPEFTAEGHGGPGLHAARSDRHRRVRRGGRDVVAELHDGIDAPVVRCDVAVGGDGQARRERRARDADLVHQRDRERVRGDRRRRRRPSPRAIGLDRRIGPAFLRAGIGYGGSCFPKDSLALKQLAANSGYNFQLLNAVIEVNELQKRRVIGKLERRLGPLRGKRIALLGLAFKPGTDDMREAPSLVLAGRLLSGGRGGRARGIRSRTARCICTASRSPSRRSTRSTAQTPRWSSPSGPSSASSTGPRRPSACEARVIVDGRNLLDPDEMRALGFTYEGIGRPVV